MRLRARYTCRSSSLPEMRTSPAPALSTKTCRNAGITSRADGPGTSASTGTSRQPSTANPSSTSTFSTAAHGAVDVVDREERDAGRVRPRGRELEVDDGPEERVGHLDQDARAVAGVGLGARRAAVVEVAHRGERQLDDRVALAALHVDHEADPAAVVLEARVVQPDLRRQVGIRGARECGRVRPRVRSSLGLGRSARRQAETGAGLRGTTLARRRSEELTGRRRALAPRSRPRSRGPARGRRAARGR